MSIASKLFNCSLNKKTKQIQHWRERQAERCSAGTTGWQCNHIHNSRSRSRSRTRIRTYDSCYNGDRCLTERGSGRTCIASEFVGESAKRRAGQAARAFSIVVMLLLIEFIAVAVCCILFYFMLLTALLFNSFVCVIWLLVFAVDIVLHIYAACGCHFRFHVFHNCWCSCYCWCCFPLIEIRRVF